MSKDKKVDFTKFDEIFQPLMENAFSKTPPRLSKIRDERAELHWPGPSVNATHARNHYRDGFEEAIDILMPEIEKLVEALHRAKNSGMGFAMHYVRTDKDALMSIAASCREALASWNAFISEESK